MIKLLQSQKIKIPMVYLIENDKDLEELPFGIPFIKSKMTNYKQCVQMLEWDILYKSALETGLPFNWHSLLEANGYNPRSFTIAHSVRSDLELDGDLTGYKAEIDTIEEIDSSEFLNDADYKVDIEVLRDLNLLPTWMESIEDSVKENISNAMVFNPMLYTKKLGLPLGDFEYGKLEKNVIIIDISGSIPRNVSKTTLILAKTFAEQFYADLLITGSKSTLYDYSEVDSLDVDQIYSENGMDNDQVWFKELLQQPRTYKSVIVFGDEHDPGRAWSNQYNKGTQNISLKQGIELCKWKVAEIISFHTTSDTRIAGYGLWFDTDKVTKISDWVKDMSY